MVRNFKSKPGSAIYTQRKAIMEPVSGEIKEARGLRCFLLRGLGKVDSEWHLIATSHSLLKLFRYRQAQHWSWRGRQAEARRNWHRSQG